MRGKIQGRTLVLSGREVKVGCRNRKNRDRTLHLGAALKLHKGDYLEEGEVQNEKGGGPLKKNLASSNYLKLGMNREEDQCPVLKPMSQ